MNKINIRHKQIKTILLINIVAKVFLDVNILNSTLYWFQSWITSKNLWMGQL